MLMTPGADEIYMRLEYTQHVWRGTEPGLRKKKKKKNMKKEMQVFLLAPAEVEQDLEMARIKPH